jgi:poly-gamma-glutamate capsule biosynthesis protein CapA/YwtB (metallophosphatase superfamily)
LIVSKNGNTLAFIGCNPAGPAPAWAKADKPGSARCDDEFLAKEIPRLKTVANVVIMTLQYEEYYEYAVSPAQVNFFKKYTDMGADIVMGSQAHVPQGFGFTDKAFIHYGIGNLFFDQQDTLLVRQMFADKLILYNGKHVSTILFTGLLEDFSRPRPMTAEERETFLKAIFKASGW